MSETPPRPVMLVILDGWGFREAAEDNAVAQADTPNFDRLWAASPHGFLRTSGLDVGLPEGQMGNSEVGHLNIGAGRVVMQDLPRIGSAIADGSLLKMPALTGLIDALRASGGTCHLMGLLSPGGVHAHEGHAVALALALFQAGVPTVVHPFLDGRDTSPRSGGAAIARLQAALPEGMRIGSVSGRYYAMDRDKRWDRVAKAYAAIAMGDGPSFADAASVVDDAYSRGVTDEFVIPAVIGGYRGMRDGDGLLCFNFRADRIRELLATLLDPDFNGFARARQPHLAAAVGMTRYSDDLAGRMDAIFAPQTMKNLLGEVVARAGRTQLRMAETEKYPHVTYFLNGGVEAENPGENRIMAPSPKVATYDLQPEMSAAELTDRAVAAIGMGEQDLIILNFGEPRHGRPHGQPARRDHRRADGGCGARQDRRGGRGAGGALLVTADHGNCELMRDPLTGARTPPHTTNPVPVFLAGRVGGKLRDGRLADIAPTLLALMGIGQPAEMDRPLAAVDRRRVRRAARLCAAAIACAGPAAAAPPAAAPQAGADQLRDSERARAALLQAQTEAVARLQAAQARGARAGAAARRRRGASAKSRGGDRGHRIPRRRPRRPRARRAGSDRRPRARPGRDAAADRAPFATTLPRPCWRCRCRPSRRCAARLRWAS